MFLTRWCNSMSTFYTYASMKNYLWIIPEFTLTGLPRLQKGWKRESYQTVGWLYQHSRVVLVWYELFCADWWLVCQPVERYPSWLLLRLLLYSEIFKETLLWFLVSYYSKKALNLTELTLLSCDKSPENLLLKLNFYHQLAWSNSKTDMDTWNSS